MLNEDILTFSAEDLLDSNFRLQPNSRLREYIKEKTMEKNARDTKSIYSLKRILNILQEAIREERMYDSRNSSIILCSKPLESVLNQKALHVAEIRDIILTQVDWIPTWTPANPARPHQAKCPLKDSQVPRPRNTARRSSKSQANKDHAWAEAQCAHMGHRPQTMTTAPQKPSPMTKETTTGSRMDADTKVRATPAFLKVLKRTPGADPHKEIFTHQEITNLLTTYIKSRKHKIFDQRNCKVALVENDLLGKAFNVHAFHECQAITLMETQLIPIKLDSSVKDDSNSNIDISQGERSKEENHLTLTTYIDDLLYTWPGPIELQDALNQIKMTINKGQNHSSSSNQDNMDSPSPPQTTPLFYAPKSPKSSKQKEVSNL